VSEPALQSLRASILRVDAPVFGHNDQQNKYDPENFFRLNQNIEPGAVA